MLSVVVVVLVVGRLVVSMWIELGLCYGGTGSRLIGLVNVDENVLCVCVCAFVGALVKAHASSILNLFR